MKAILRRATFLSLWLATAAAAGASAQAPKVNETEYEGWRQYNVHCARCHGQDALPNPVAANLLTSMAPDGPAADQKTFMTIVMDGRASRGMPGFKGSVEPAQVEAMYLYLKGRAEKRIPPGRPERPAS